MGHEFLANTALTVHQHGAIRRGSRDNFGPQCPDGVTLPGQSQTLSAGVVFAKTEEEEHAVSNGEFDLASNEPPNLVGTSGEPLEVAVIGDPIEGSP